MLRTRGFAFASVLLVLALVLVAGERTAHADDPPLETADGPTACHEFQTKNDRELTKWEKDQPSVSYAYPREDDVLGSPWGRFLKTLETTSGLLLATFVPHAGAQLRGETPAALVSWPWSLPFGPAFSCSRKPNTLWVRRHRAHRLLLEPGIVSSTRGTGVHVRPGYRFVYHPADWVVGVGAGLGSTVEIAGNREPFRVSIGPEAIAHFGHCCAASYFTFAVRYDRFFRGTNLDILGASLGYTFF